MGVSAKRSDDKMDNEVPRRILPFFGAFLAALLAALFTLYAFKIPTPPRDINALLNPSPTPSPFVPPSPTPTRIAGLPFRPPIIFSDDFSRPGIWPVDRVSSYSSKGFDITAAPQSEYAAVSVPEFNGTQYNRLGIVAQGVPIGSADTEYGIFFWHSVDRQGLQRFLAFTISTRGNYRLRAFTPFTDVSGERLLHWVDLTSETPLRAIKANAPNRIRLEVTPGRFSAYINDIAALSRNNPDIDAYHNRNGYDGAVGLVVVAGQQSAQVQFNQFVLYAVGEQ